MFKITKKQKTPNIIWDTSNNRPLCKFVNGIVETSEESLAVKLQELGHTVEGGADTKSLDKMKVDELKAYATEHKIDLGDVTNKADILKIIQETESKR